MRNGINYDTGFLSGDSLSRKVFDSEVVRREMRVIAEELHCDAVRVSGGRPERLSVAAEHAAAAGLEVWFAPFPVDRDEEAMLKLYADCADRAEAVRRGGAGVVLVTGCETSVFGRGFMPGATYLDRLRTMVDAGVEGWQGLGPVMSRFNGFLARAAEVVRPRFGGRISYAAGPWEVVDWAPFDVVGVDLYRAGYNAESFVGELRGHFASGKPVVVIEYGTCAYEGAGERGGMAWQVPPGAVPDEGEQVRYFTRSYELFEREGVEAAFWFTFAGYTRLGESDLGSYGVVRMLDETRWEPKQIFHTMAERYTAGIAPS